MLAPPPPPLDARGPAQGFSHHITDMHAGCVEGQWVGARSPRTVALRAQNTGVYNPQDDEIIDDEIIDDAIIDEVVPDRVNAPGNEDNDNGAVFCHVCQMYLNGPTPWADHRIGKQHNTNCKTRASTQVWQ